MKIYIKEDRTSGGVASFLHWEHPDILKGLHTMFHVDTENEEIKDIVVDDYGIVAYFTTDNKKEKE